MTNTLVLPVDVATRMAVEENARTEYAVTESGHDAFKQLRDDERVEYYEYVTTQNVAFDGTDFTVRLIISRKSDDTLFAVDYTLPAVYDEQVWNNPFTTDRVTFQVINKTEEVIVNVTYAYA